MKRIPVADGFVEVERRGGLWVYLEEPLELSERGQLLATAVLHWYAGEHRAAHPRSEGWITFGAGPDVVYVDTLDAAQADRCLEGLLATFRLFARPVGEEEWEARWAA